jgi:hypothetical protein
MSGIALPQGLEQKLDSLAADVKRWRFRRGVSLSAVVVCAVPVALVLLDRSLQLSAWLRVGLLALLSLVVGDPELEAACTGLRTRSGD